MNVNELITSIRTWQKLSDRYTAACEETRQRNDGKSYPSSPERRTAIKALDDHAMELIHDVHNDAVLEMLVTLADEIERLQAKQEAIREAVTFSGIYVDGFYRGVVEAVRRIL